jgi:hypothetical protein
VKKGFFGKTMSTFVAFMRYLRYKTNFTTTLFVVFSPPPHGLRHPQIFYYGHTACLYINKLRVAGVLSKAVNPYFESIFEVGVDEMLWDDMHKNDKVC